VPPKRASLSDRAVSVAPAPRPTDDAILGAERRRQEVRELDLREIMPNRLQPRTRPSSEGLDDLAASIREHGVLSPVLVRAIPLTAYEGAGCRYELVAGERRWRASRLAGRTTLPALLVEDAADDRAMLELAITENLQREDLHPLDEALALGRMHQELGYSFAQIADRLGKSKGYVQNRLRLLQLGDDLQRLVAERPDTLGHVYEIGRLADGPERQALIAAVRDDRISRAETRIRVEALLNPPAPYFQKYDGSADALGGGPSQAESYFQKYDGPGAAPGGEAGKAESYFQKYDGQAGGLLTPRERGAMVSVAGKLARALRDPGLLTAEDWAAIEPMIRQLGDLARIMGEAGPAES
jgi:ParB family transcriptional regulator, chromosome partitioning protein